MTAQSMSTEEFAERLAREAARIEPVLEQVLPRQADDHLSEAIWYHMGTGGKRVRPAICLLTCEKLGGDSQQALPFAAAVEILHNMLLIHDDVEDEDTVRRDRDTVWVKYGVGNAINVGDYMLGAAYRATVQTPVSDRSRVRLVGAFTDAYQDTCRGQAMDLNYRARRDFAVDDYMTLVTLKTGRYMALAMVGGAIVAGLGDQVVERIEQLGRCMGAAFQIRDDVIDLTVGKGRGGVLGNDIREGKSSILYAHALAEASAAERDLLLEVMARPRERTSEQDVERICRLYKQLGSLDYARTQSDRLVEEAFDVVESIPVRDEGFFRDLTRFMVSRTT